MRSRCKEGLACLRIRPFAIQMGTKQSRLRRKPPSELLGWRERRTDDKPSSEKEVEGATHAVGQAATPSPGINILRTYTPISTGACC